MKAKYVRFLIFTLIMIIILSCEKEKDYPKKYVFDSVNPGMIKGYTNTGEITDELKIVDFIGGHSEYFWQSDNQANDWQVEIEIISDSKAKIFDSDTTIYFDLEDKNGIIYFQFQQSLISYMPLVNERLKYSPLNINTTMVPGGSGQQQIYTYFPCYYFIESNGELHVPMVSYVEKIYSNTGEFLSNQGIGNYNNVFDTTYLSKVQTEENVIDTIVYQDNKIIFKQR